MYVYTYTVRVGYNVVERTEDFVSLHTSVALTEDGNVAVNNEELLCITEYLTQ
jgi:hypothetical protein